MRTPRLGRKGTRGGRSASPAAGSVLAKGGAEGDGSRGSLDRLARLSRNAVKKIANAPSPPSSQRPRNRTSKIVPGARANRTTALQPPFDSTHTSPVVAKTAQNARNAAARRKTIVEVDRR